jgi:hypothetical protein
MLLVGFSAGAGLLSFLVGLASFFFLGPEAGTLRNEFFRGAPAAWHQKLAVNVGPLTAGAMRLGARLFNAPPEARAGIDAFEGAEVGIYRTAEYQGVYAASRLAGIDKAMARRGWQPIVKVIHDAELVLVYLPANNPSTGRVRCCFLVAHENELVVGSAKCNLKPLLNLPEVQKAFDTSWSQHLSPSTRL